MSERTCTIDGCQRPAWKARGWCRPHYERWRRYGDPVGRPPTTSFEERFWAKVDRSHDCWLWTGAVDHTGYGRVKGVDRILVAHRVAYELLMSPIPPGMYVDHMCFNRRCVNPEHLRLATPKQNIENLAGATRRSKSGIRGVSWCKRDNRWIAFVRHGDRRINVGRFDDIRDAEAAVIAKRNELFTHNLIDRVQD